MTTLMRGATNLRKAVGQYFEAYMPVQIDIANAQWSFDQVDYQLEKPSAYDIYDILGLDTLIKPVIAVRISRVSRPVLTDISDGSYEEYAFTYSGNIFIYSHTPIDAEGHVIDKDGYLMALQQRDDLGAIALGLILDRPSMASGGAIKTVIPTLTLDYSDPVRMKGDRWLAAAAIGFDIEFTESLWRPIIGVADTIDVNTQPLLTP